MAQARHRAGALRVSARAVGQHRRHRASPTPHHSRVSLLPPQTSHGFSSEDFKEEHYNFFTATSCVLIVVYHHFTYLTLHFPHLGLFLLLTHSSMTMNILHIKFRAHPQAFLCSRHLEKDSLSLAISGF